MRNGLTHAEAGRLGAEKTKETIKLKKLERVKKYNNNPTRCKECNNSIPYEKRANKFCSKSCAATFNNKGIDRHKKHRKKFKIEGKKKVSIKKNKIHKLCIACGNELAFNNKFCNLKCRNNYQHFIIGQQLTKDSQLKGKQIRTWLLQEKDYKCEVCNLSEWQNKPIPIEVDHVDGDYTNNLLSNLRFVCLNCHGQTSTYRAKNKGNGRHYRRQRYNDGKSF
jgi:predicted nucleic acid-binding Zn ribbon protein